MTRPPLAPLGEHSRPGWFLERRRLACKHLQTAEGAVELDGTPEGIQPCLGDLEKRVQPAMESAGLKWFPVKSLTIADTEIGGLVRR